MSDSRKTDQRIKVVHVYKDFDIHNGLIESFFIFAKHFDHNQFDTRVCVFKSSNSRFSRHFISLGGKLDSLGASWESNPLIIWKLYKYFMRVKPHIVQTYVLKPNLYGRLAALLARVPIIISTELTLRDQAPTWLRRIRDEFLHPINGYLNNHTDLVVCASEMIKSQWQNSAIEEKLKVIYPPFDASKLSAVDTEALESEFEKNGNLVIGTIGRLSEEKRHIDLIKAFEKVSSTLPETKLLIVGDGYLRRYLEKVVEESDLQEKVVFLGFQENVIKSLRKMDLFVLPSRTEGFGIALVEAMATGIPVIATAVGGIPEIINDNINGLLVPPGQPSDLAEAIIKLLSNSEFAKKMGDNGRKKALINFHPDHFITQHETLYKRIASAKGLLRTN